MGRLESASGGRELEACPSLVKDEEEVAAYLTLSNSFPPPQQEEKVCRPVTTKRQLQI
jgi:hypothetical protein